MKKRLKNPQTCLLLSLIAAIPATILHTLAYLTAYGTEGSNYFSAAGLPTISSIFAILACLLAGVAVLLWKNKPLSVNASKNRLFALPAAVGFLISGTLFLLSNTTKLTYAISVCCFLAAIYLASYAFSLIEDSFVLAFFGFFSVIACILLNGYFYFDKALELNAPLKTNTMLGMLIAMLYLVSELKILIGNTMPRMLCLTAACTTGLGALSAFPIPLAFLFGKFDRTAELKNPTAMTSMFEHPEYFAGAIVILGISITTALRLIEILTRKEEA